MVYNVSIRIVTDLTAEELISVLGATINRDPRILQIEVGNPKKEGE